MFTRKLILGIVIIGVVLGIVLSIYRAHARASEAKEITIRKARDEVFSYVEKHPGEFPFVSTAGLLGLTEDELCRHLGDLMASGRIRVTPMPRWRKPILISRRDREGFFWRVSVAAEEAIKMMGADAWFAETIDRCARVNWKTTADEALFAMRDELGERHGFLFYDAFDELVDNQAGEDTEAQLLSLGQEMTSYGFFLYSVDEGSEEYCLVLIPLTANEAFTAWLEKNDREANLLKQPDTEAGIPARRIQH